MHGETMKLTDTAFESVCIRTIHRH